MPEKSTFKYDVPDNTFKIGMLLAKAKSNKYAITKTIVTVFFLCGFSCNFINFICFFNTNPITIDIIIAQIIKTISILSSLKHKSDHPRKYKNNTNNHIKP